MSTRPSSEHGGEELPASWLEKMILAVMLVLLVAVGVSFFLI